MALSMQVQCTLSKALPTSWERDRKYCRPSRSMLRAARALPPTQLPRPLLSPRPASRASLAASFRSSSCRKIMAAAGNGTPSATDGAANGASAASQRSARLSSEGARAATQLVDAAEESVERLERVL